MKEVRVTKVTLVHERGNGNRVTVVDERGDSDGGTVVRGEGYG